MDQTTSSTSTISSVRFEMADVDMTDEQFNQPRFYYIAADSEDEAQEVEEVIDEGGPMDFAVDARFIVNGCSVNAPGDDSDDDSDIYADMPDLVSSPDIDKDRSDFLSDIEMPQLISVDFDDDEPMVNSQCSETTLRPLKHGDSVEYLGTIPRDQARAARDRTIRLARNDLNYDLPGNPFARFSDYAYLRALEDANARLIVNMAMTGHVDSDLTVHMYAIVDSGALRSVRVNPLTFVRYAHQHTPIQSFNRKGDSTRSLHSVGNGSIDEILGNDPAFRFQVCDALHVPDAPFNIISTNDLEENGYDVVLSRQGSYIRRPATKTSPERRLPIHKLRNGLLFVEFDGYVTNTTPVYNITPKPNPQIPDYIIHKRLGHVATQRLADLYKGAQHVDVLDVVQTKEQRQCEICIRGRLRREPFPRLTARETTILGALRLDLQGPFNPSTQNGYRYDLIITDETTRFKWIYLIARKAHALGILLDFITFVEKQTGYEVKVLCMDRGELLSNKTFVEFCQTKGIVIEGNVAYVKQSNAIAERALQEVNDISRCFHIQSRLPASCWGFAHIHAVYIMNLLPPTSSVTSAVLDKRTTPYEAFFRHKPRSSHIRAYGCAMWVESPKEKRDSTIETTDLSKKTSPPKIADRRIPKIYIGAHSPSMVIALDPVTRSVSFHRFADTVFDESSFPGLGQGQLSQPPSDPIDLSDKPDPAQFVDDSLKDQDATLKATLERRARMMLDPVSTLTANNTPSRPGVIIPSQTAVVPVTDVSVPSFWPSFNLDIG